VALTRFAEKSVIVTGAGNGIGLRCAEAFAADGAWVTIADIDGDAAASAAKRIDRSRAATVERFGGVDVLVNNAGLHMGRYNLTSTLSLEEWRRLFDVNLFGVGAYSISKLALNGLTLSLAQEFAPDNIRVVGIAPGMVASEAVLSRLEDVHKQAVLGGQLVKRFGQLDDLVEFVLLLCSEGASFLTGQTVTIDGGFVKRI
jgi:3-oxoacyl-[acyl-carrier protein] reductase